MKKNNFFNSYIEIYKREKILLYDNVSIFIVIKKSSSIYHSPIVTTVLQIHISLGFKFHE